MYRTMRTLILKEKMCKIKDIYRNIIIYICMYV